MMEQKSSLDQTSSESFFFFNPRTPCGVRPGMSGLSVPLCRFQSTHSLRSATSPGVLTWSNRPFQSTHSLRSATVYVRGSGFHVNVSIHALLAECDAWVRETMGSADGFNPRTPCGVRQYATGLPASVSRFQSTHSLRSATPCCGGVRYPAGVSIHALLAECDRNNKRNTN